MRKIEKTTQIFIADDGEKFDSEQKCKRHQIDTCYEMLNMKVLIQNTIIMVVLTSMDHYIDFIKGLVLEGRIKNINCIHTYIKELFFPNKFVAVINKNGEYAEINYFEAIRNTLHQLQEEVDKFDRKY